MEFRSMDADQNTPDDSFFRNSILFDYNERRDLSLLKYDNVCRPIVHVRHRVAYRSTDICWVAYDESLASDLDIITINMFVKADC